MKGEIEPVWAVVPVKHFENAKSRLAPVLSGPERTELARTLFEHVVGVLKSSKAISGVLVVTDSPTVIEAAMGLGCVARRDPEGARTLADCVDGALAELAGLGAASAVVLVSDLPDVRTRDVDDLVGGLHDFDVVLAPDKGGDHTNALALRIGSMLATSFGAADSLRRHADSAAKSGLSASTIHRPTLAFDVDTPEDYVLLRARR